MMRQRVSVAATLIFALALPAALAVADEPRAWVAASDAHAAVLLQLTAKYRPEDATGLGLVGYEGEILVDAAGRRLASRSLERKYFLPYTDVASLVFGVTRGMLDPRTPAVSDPLGGLRGSMSFMLLGRRGGRAGHIYFGDSNQCAILI